MAFLKNHKILDPSHSGFRTGYSTETALVAVMDSINCTLDVGLSAMLVLLDLFMAFNTISHAGMIRRLQAIGVENVALLWLTDFLENHTQSCWVLSNHALFSVVVGDPQK